MDVTCATCGEPWDTYHLRYDEVHETEAGTAWIEHKLDCEAHEHDMLRFSPAMRKACKPPRPPDIEKWEGKLTPFWRAQFEARGWKFGSSVSAVLRCPFCKKGKELEDVDERMEARKVISELLEGDEDGIDTELEDLAIVERY